MNFDEYQKKALATAVYPKNIGMAYCAMGLSGEAGEIANKVKKFYRDEDERGKVLGEYESYADFIKNGTLTDVSERRNSLAYELGDQLWYLALIAEELGLTLSQVAEMNITKLNSRRERGVIQGSGDNR